MKTTLIIAFAFLVSLCSAQDKIYQKVNSLLKQNNPSLIVDNKVLVVNFVNNLSNSFSYLEKAGNTYESAKLKGGRSGIICVNVVKDSQTEIALNKQGYKHIYVINGSEIGGVNTNNWDNVTFDSNGNIIYKNLESDKIYEAINQLITR